MAYNSYATTWRGENYDDVSEKDRVQDINLNQLKLKVNDTYKKDEKITTNFEATNGTDIMNKAYLDKVLSKMQGQISNMENHYKEFKLLINKQSVSEEAVKAIIQIVYDKGLFDYFPNAGKIKKDFLFVEHVDLI